MTGYMTTEIVFGDAMVRPGRSIAEVHVGVDDVGSLDAAAAGVVGGFCGDGGRRCVNVEVGAGSFAFGGDAGIVSSAVDRGAIGNGVGVVSGCSGGGGYNRSGSGSNEGGWVIGGGGVDANGDGDGAGDGMGSGAGVDMGSSAGGDSDNGNGVEAIEVLREVGWFSGTELWWFLASQRGLWWRCGLRERR